MMKEYNIRKKLPSVKVDLALIKQLEDYILNVVPSIVGVEKDLVLKEYSLTIVDSLGTGKFNRISDFPLTMFQNGTEKVRFGFSLYSDSRLSIEISFSKDKYSSDIDISLKGDNPSEIAKGIYTEILSRILQHRTKNYIYHTTFFQAIGPMTMPLIVVSLYIYKNHFIWALYIFLFISLLIFISSKGEHLKPYSEFSTSNQIKNNNTFNYIVLSIIIPLFMSIIYDFLK